MGQLLQIVRAVRIDQRLKGEALPTVLEIPAGHSSFLRRLFESALSFVRKELAIAPGCARARLQREEEVYEELLEAIDTGLIEADLDAQVVLADLVAAIDGDNEYSRITGEHEALMTLIRQMPEARCS